MDREPLVKRIRAMLYGVLFRGSRYTCPFCKSSFSRFLSGGAKAKQMTELQAIGIGRRLNARCPNCGSNDRARLKILYLRTTEIFSGRPIKILHIAPDRHVANVLRAQSSVEHITGSLHPEDFADLNACRVDVAAIPFDDNSFDVVLCNHVLQQVPDDRRAMREIARVLKPTGFGILQAPTALGLEKTLEDASVTTPQEKRQKFGSTLHLRLYGRDYAERLTQAGLTVTRTHPIRDGWCLDAARYAVIDNEELHVVRKA